MAKVRFLCSALTYHHHHHHLLLLLILIILSIVASGEETKNFYIVYLGDSPGSNDSAVQTHIGLLSSVKGSEHDAKESIVYSYTKSFNAFAAKLSKDEAEMLKELDEVASVFPNRYHKVHTTKSWDFIGLPLTARRNLKLERNIIVGLLDTGITPQSESFKDDGLGPPPSKWNGTCGHFANFSGCNRKIIGAKYFKLDGNPDPDDILSPIDVDGHGTHTSSTLAASGIDRQFRSIVKLGNGESFSGIGIDTFKPKENFYPIVSGADVAMNSESKENAKFCYDNSLDPGKVKGRLVYCRLGQWGADSVVKGIGGIGTIVGSEQFLDTAQIFMAPATMVNVTLGETIEKYIHSTRSPSAVIYRSQEVKVSAPFAASFSSRGPNPGSQHLLKPDIAAPGVDILAAYTLLKSLTGQKGDTQYSKFTLMSGTSMACPHAAGVAAYVKSFHPTWSPAAIKSAIMTTAKPMSRRVNKDAEFAYGAGQLNPARALNPGLVYDMDEMSYIQFLCHEGYSGSSIAHLVGTKSINCSSFLPGFGYDALNYPSMQLNMENGQQPTVGVFRRRVTNVGPPSVYNATIKAPKGVQITVKPTSLFFTRHLQKRSFKVVVKAKPVASTTFTVLSASLVWKSTRHIVRSPIVIYSLQD
ncbi:subtilisin-like protease SBT4.14 isoform X3 [Durio zibethinus]|uniref:Subtilisin-like protease SBT4.14 isoform X3 n=1 Tax=Durio zibethinus TaxID=66656 RepID=A0A6P6AXV5_DURZI|nr:subtilisin-like protease SBT4.14 isoform X3 [Durio zibethinus]